ncbi:MAG TPA: FeoB-associated Cys-rich membrane protein [Clostridiaceae bacterium]|nr:FeoB-associated Cys-rich membrane protein [Clostridiaceae bacterium]
MINWILGGAIIVLAVFIIIRMIVKMRKGESVCCSGCSFSKENQCYCSKKL